ncbi:MAG: hypothetical protein MJ179_09295, partial [Treponema sp.]|nr:hypothetical protein [Treponema sp.]
IHLLHGAEILFRHLCGDCVLSTAALFVGETTPEIYICHWFCFAPMRRLCFIYSSTVCWRNFSSIYYMAHEFCFASYAAIITYLPQHCLLAKLFIHLLHGA